MNKKHCIALLSSAIILGTTGCSTVQSGLESVKGSLSTAVSKVSQLTKSTVSNITGNKPAESSDSIAEAAATAPAPAIAGPAVEEVAAVTETVQAPIEVAESEVEEVIEEAVEIAQTPEVISAAEALVQPVLIKPSKLAESIAGQWNITQAGVSSIDMDDMPYIFFEPAKGRFYANNGCNTLNGSFAVDDNTGKIEFDNVLSTMRYCPDAPYEMAINTVIIGNRPARMEITQLGAETVIDLLDSEGKTMMRLSRGELDFLNGHWSIESISGMESLDTAADIFFDLPELKLHGNTGCNYFNGDIYLDHRVSGGIDFSNMALTRMACPFTTQETAMMVALEQTAAAINGDNGRAMLIDSQGRELMTLKSLSPETEEE